MADDETPPSVQQRIDAATAARNAALEQVAALKAELATAAETAKQAAELAAAVEAYRVKEAGWAKDAETVAQREAAWAEERAVMQAGVIDPEGVEIARLLWARTPADKRPTAPDREWVAAQRALGPFLAQPAAVNGHAGLPPSNKGAAPSPPGGTPKLSPSDIAKLSPEEWARVREDVLAGRR